MKTRSSLQIFFIFLVLSTFLLVKCHVNTSYESGRHCLYILYKDIRYNISVKKKAILKIMFEEWQSDSILFVYSYYDTVITELSDLHETELFHSLVNNENSFKHGYSLNFDTRNKLIEVYNLKKIKYFNISVTDSVPVYVFEYYPARSEEDAEMFLFYNPNLGILAEYSPVWDNLILLDSIYSKKKYFLNNLQKKIVNDSSFFPVPK